MRQKRELPVLPGYISVKEAARKLGVSEKRVYDFLDEERLEAVRAGGITVISEKSVEGFKPKVAGRQRTVTPTWRMSTDENTRIITSIVVQLRPGQQGKLMERLQEMRQEKRHLFPGTGDRYIAEDDASPGTIEIQLRWKQYEMPSEAARDEALEAFKQTFADVLDWDTARYSTKTVLLHTS